MGKFKSMFADKLDDLVDKYERLIGRDLTDPEMNELQKIENDAMKKLFFAQPSVGNPQLERIKQKIVDDAIEKAKTYLETLIPVSRNVVIQNPDGGFAMGESYNPPREPLPRGWGMPIELYPERTRMPRTVDFSQQPPASGLIGGAGGRRFPTRPSGAGTGL